VADIGCGNGGDSFVFASIVGPKGTVFAEEIGEALVKSVLAGARERKVRQVVPVLGETDDPRLPDGSIDLAYMHYVFHHLANPASMLRNIWLDLKPGGRLGIVEMGVGGGLTRDWAALTEREKSHHPLGETTVVREVREAGFRFVDLLDDSWSDKKDSALVFEKPRGLEEPAGDPDLPLPVDPARVAEALAAAAGTDGAGQAPGGSGGPPPSTGRPPCALVVALDRGREALPAVAARLGAGARILDVVLEEWATSKDEAPPAPAGLKVEVLRTEGGRPALPEGASIDLAVFADTYGRLWDPAPLLKGIRGRLAPGARVVVVDRKGPEGEPRRLSGHRRRISPQLVREEMGKLGFELLREVPPPAADRFALVFRARQGERWVRAPSRPEEPAGI